VKRKKSDGLTIGGLTLPQYSAFDPKGKGEGSLDPLGLGAISERLAKRLAPAVTNRMNQPHWLTAIAVGALACDGLDDVAPLDRVTTPSVAFEWLVLEAFVRRQEGRAMPLRIPGVQKARDTVVVRGGRLSHRTYLKSASVFGFHGIYRPFAVRVGVLTDTLHFGAEAVSLARTWEADADLKGFVDQVPGSDGARVRKEIRNAVGNALTHGELTVGKSQQIFGYLSRALLPDFEPPMRWPVVRERLRSLVFDPAMTETTCELLRLLLECGAPLDAMRSQAMEAETLARVRPAASPALGELIDAVVAFENFAAPLTAMFNAVRGVSSASPARPVHYSDVVQRTDFVAAANVLTERFERLHACVPGDREPEAFAASLRLIVETQGAEQLEALMARHAAVQRNKGDKPEWFDHFPQGWIVRREYRDEPTREPSEWVHPVFVTPLANFLYWTAP